MFCIFKQCYQPLRLRDKTCATIAHFCRSLAMEKHRYRSRSRSDRSRSRSRGATYHVSSVQQVAFHDDLSQTAVDPKPQVLWLVDQSDRWPGYWRVAEKFASAMEIQFQDRTESANGELVLKNGEVHYYRHTMINGAEMLQIRFHDEERSSVMFKKRLARVIMQRSRDDRWGPTTPPRS